MDSKTLAIEILTWLGCPACNGPLTSLEQGLLCPAGDQFYPIQNGILRLLPPGQQADADTFAAEYGRRRRKQEWRCLSAEEMAALPETTPAGWDGLYWSVRRQSYRVLAEQIDRIQHRLGRPLRIVDMGAGTGWLAGRLATGGHQVVALDLSCDDAFGLGAAGRLRHLLGLPMVLVQGAIEEPPFQQGQLDILIYNASLHYAGDIQHCLEIGARLLRPEGLLAIMDSPVAGSETTAKNGQWPGGRQIAQDQLENALAGANLNFDVLHIRRGLRWRLRQFRIKAAGSAPFALPYIAARRA